MKIAQINTVLNSGSTGRIAEQIGECVTAAGHRSLIAYGRHANSSASPSYKIGGLLDTFWHGIESVLFDRQGLGSRGATQDLVRELCSFKPDLIVLHNIHGYYLNYPILFDYLRSSQCPVVWTLHDCWPITGHCAHFTRFDCTRWQSECGSCPMTHFYPFSLSDKSSRNFRLKKEYFNMPSRMTLVTPSRWLKTILERSFLAQYPVEVINNGIDLELFSPGKADSRRDIVLGVANKWTSSKGLDDFIAMRDVLPFEYEIVLVGTSRAQIKRLPRGIHGVVRTENTAELAKWYQSATVFANPTYNDNFPTTILEALACGTPVVTYTTGGCAEAIDDHTGRSVPKGDVDRLAQEVLGFLRGRCDTVQRACRRRAETLYKNTDRYSDYRSLFESIVY